MLRTVFTILFFSTAGALCAQNVPTYYISPPSGGGTPKMPPLKFNAKSSPNMTFTSKSEHKKRGNKDNIFLKSPANSSNFWDVNSSLKNKIFGGIVEVKSAQNNAVIAKFKIRGQNPKDEDVKKFISENCKDHWYAAAIAQHESRQRFYVFNQFNSSYYKPSIVGVPNCGLPDGWGIMQIDSRRGSDIKTSEVYNWQDNVRAGIAVMDNARKEAIGYFSAIKRTFPKQWEEPPSSILIKGTKTRLSYIDACVIQLYNGASVVRRLKTAFGTYSYYRSAFVFDENADEGERWKFKPNVNNYVYKVVFHEIENNIKTQNEPAK